MHFLNKKVKNILCYKVLLVDLSNCIIRKIGLGYLDSFQSLTRLRDNVGQRTPNGVEDINEEV